MYGIACKINCHGYYFEIDSEGHNPWETVFYTAQSFEGESHACIYVGKFPDRKLCSKYQDLKMGCMWQKSTSKPMLLSRKWEKKENTNWVFPRFELLILCGNNSTLWFYSDIKFLKMVLKIPHENLDIQWLSVYCQSACLYLSIIYLFIYLSASLSVYIKHREREIKEREIDLSIRPKCLFPLTNSKLRFLTWACGWDFSLNKQISLIISA